MRNGGGGPALAERTTTITPVRPQPVADERPRGGGLVRRLLIDVALVGVMSALVFARGVWAADAILLPLLFLLPGTLLLRALRVPANRIRAFPVYVPCASIVVLLGAGLIANFGAPAIGIEPPLRTLPLLAATSGLCLLLALAGVGARPEVGVPWRMPQLRPWRGWPLLLPATAAVGALLFNSGHGRGVAVAGLAAAVGAVMVCTLLGNRMTKTELALAIFSIALAAGWSFSLRSHFVYGWDITSEYRVAQGTYAAGVWHTYHPKDAYSAMLSLTTFPATLQALAGTSALFLFKVVYPVLFALFPVGLFGLANRLVGRRYAFVAAALLVVQGFFFQQMSGLARQEIGLLVFVALTAAVLETQMPRRAQWPLVAAFGLALVVSHYSTTYLAIDMLAGYCVIQLLVFALRRSRPVTGAAVVALVVTVAGAMAWYVPVTQSSSNATNFITNVEQRGFDFLPNAKPGQSPIEAYLKGNIASRIEANQFERDMVQEDARLAPWLNPLPSASDPRYALQDASVPSETVRSPRAVDALDMEQTLVSQGMNALAVIGALALVWWRRASPFARQLGILGLSTLVALALMRLSGTVAAEYTPERAIVQMMVPLVIGIAWLLEAIARRWLLLRLLIPLGVALALGGVFLTTSGLRAVLAGGAIPTNLADRGEDYERFYIKQSELAGARWLDATVPRRDVINADRYGQLRIFGTTPRAKGVLTEVFPMTLDRHAWVYAYGANVLGGRARARLNERYTLYEWPNPFLNDKYDLVYDNGTAKIYHGP